ncbi:coiled-coil domain-containing protein 83-like [Antedon mediterranea]|uniref:coiled-coil domain-containing protein 83-like n=1 Tax=Antedon mediterranea TaxID=105859 RepID=UPI003AF93804
MGKKGKKKDGSGKKSGKKKGGKKGKKPSEPEMTIKEAILAYQINIKEKSLEEFMYEIKGLEEQNTRHKERNQRLKEEQLYHIKTLLKEAKDDDKDVEQKSVISKAEVETTMKEKWAIEKQELKHIEEIEQEIAKRKLEVEEAKGHVTKWQNYKEKGSHVHTKQIIVLEHELGDMQNSFLEMQGHLEKTLGVAKDEIRKSTEQRLDEQKYIASEKAMTTLDKFSTQEVKDNDWLKRETHIHREEKNSLQEEVEQLEHENLGIMSELFDCKVSDLKISRNFFLSQYSDEDTQRKFGLLENDLSQIEPTSSKIVSGSRPLSATQRAVEAKLASLKLREDGASSGAESDHLDDDPTECLLRYEDEEFDEYLKLGPVELKLLSISGEQKPIHPPKKLSNKEVEAKLSAPDIWPVTEDMVNKLATT